MTSGEQKVSIAGSSQSVSSYRLLSRSSLAVLELREGQTSCVQGPAWHYRVFINLESLLLVTVAYGKRVEEIDVVQCSLQRLQ